MLERRELDAFLTLADELHFGRTAERLHVSTAQVSQTIQALERKVGAPLFHRTSRRVALSPLGQQLYEDVRPAWDAIGAAVARAVETGRGFTGTLRVAFTDAAGAQLLADVAARFRTAHPECRVEFVEIRAADVESSLAAGLVDVALATLPAPGVSAGPVLVAEARFLAVAADHPFTRTTVTVADLARVTVLTGPGTLQELLTAAAAGDGVVEVGAHVRRYHPRQDVAYVPVTDAEPLRHALLWHTATARVAAFRAAADEVAG